MNKPTPGPWTLEPAFPEDTGLWRIRFRDEDENLLDNQGVAVCASEGNARLIVTAPEMLAALKALDFSRLSYEEGLRIDAIIKKAEGREL